ncbi:hypothetical protein R3I94_002591 [Phoxinus phoxinus]
MMVYQKIDSCEEIVKMDMEYERKTTFSKGRSRKTGIFVLLGTVCMIIFIIMTSVILFHQQRTFSVLESWMDIHSSNQTSAKPQEKNIETLMTNLASSITSKQEENQQKLERQQGLSHTEVKSLMNSLSSAVSALTSELSDAAGTSSSDLEKLKSSIQVLYYKLSYLFPAGCTETEWMPNGRSSYLFSADRKNWTQAKHYCEEQGALLLKIEDGSKNEWQFITSFAYPRAYWVGLTDQNTGEWRWADETPYTMNKAQWRPGQPDDWTEHGLGEEGEDCAHIASDRVFNDIHCSSKLKYICEKENSDSN